MNHFRFKKYLTSNSQFEREKIETLLSKCQVRLFQKGDFLVKQGEVCNHTFFVENGLLRQYSIDEKGKEHIIQFAPENWFMADRESLHFHLPANYFIQAIENTSVYIIDETLINELSEKDKTFMEFNFQLLHNHIRHLQKRITQLQSASAEERYLYFIKIYPDLTLRVPQLYIASYLGITPESLSRVRKELARK